MENFPEIWNVKYIGFVNYSGIFWYKKKANVSGVKRMKNIKV